MPERTEESGQPTLAFTVTLIHAVLRRHNTSVETWSLPAGRDSPKDAPFSPPHAQSNALGFITSCPHHQRWEVPPSLPCRCFLHLSNLQPFSSACDRGSDAALGTEQVKVRHSKQEVIAHYNKICNPLIRRGFIRLIS